MFQHATPEKKVREKIIKFLALIYESTSIIIDEHRDQIYQSFIKECFTRMQAEEDLAAKGDLIQNTLAMLRNFFVQTEQKGGTMSLRQHNTIIKERTQVNELLFVFENLAKVNLDNAPKFALLTVDSSLTLWELYDLIARQVNKSPLQITLHRMKDKTDLSEASYCKSLAELKIENNEEIYVNNKFKSQQKVPLCSELTKGLTR